MESTELKQQIRILEAHVWELEDLIWDARLDPIIRGKIIARLIEQSNRLDSLLNLA